MSDILAVIDDTLAGYEGAVSSEGGDMMRWSPQRVICDGGKPVMPGRIMRLSSTGTIAARYATLTIRVDTDELNRALAGFTAMTEAMERSFAAMVPGYRKFGEALAAAFGLTVASRCALAPRSHRRRCRECNPWGNPLPLAIDGREYRRRQLARRRRKRR